MLLEDVIHPPFADGFLCGGILDCIRACPQHTSVSWLTTFPLDRHGAAGDDALG